MNASLRKDADHIITASLQAVLPDAAVRRALAAAPGIDGLSGAAVFSVGSDGTDGPTGGYVDGETSKALKAAGLDVFAVLRNNDAYHALLATDGLIVTGPTGTNVNDVAVALLRA